MSPQIDKMAQEILAEIMAQHDTQDREIEMSRHPERVFPHGKSGYNYMSSECAKGFVLHRYCWSKFRNENGKFVSWVYKFDATGKRAEMFDFVEHSKKWKAELRAKRMRDKRNVEVEGPE